MTTEVTVLRVFTDINGKFGNPLGVIDAAVVQAADYQQIATRLGFTQTVFVEPPQPDSATATANVRIFTPTAESAFVGQPAVGAAWWLRNRGTPIRSLQPPAGVVEVNYAAELAIIYASASWTPEFVLHELNSPHDVMDADPDDYFDGAPHYVWAWINRGAGYLRSRSFTPELGVHDDEATGAAAIRITAQLRRGLTITQGKGSLIHTRWSASGGVGIGGRVVRQGLVHLV
ncbi:hypothetical protein A9X02_08990 [Mycobacterium malmoense]|nr:PhzF family phenazine biosynthesis protein [Mycobacterium malmoense]OCB56108.1 hypothetical protein A9X02_08990 [Mycobacterium malmoense]